MAIRYHYILIRMVKIQNTDNTKCWQECVAAGTLIHCWQKCKKDTVTIKDSLAVSYKTKHTLTILSSNQVPWYLPKGAENLSLHENLHMDVYSNFIHNCQNSETTKMSFSRELDKQTAAHRRNYYSVLKRYELSRHEKTRRKHKYIQLSGRSLSEKVTCYMIPTMTFQIR